LATILTCRRQDKRKFCDTMACTGSGEAAQVALLDGSFQPRCQQQWELGL